MHQGIEELKLDLRAIKADVRMIRWMLVANSVGVAAILLMLGVLS